MLTRCVFFPAGIPIIDERGILKEKILEKGSYNECAPEKAGYDIEQGEGESRWEIMKMNMNNLKRPMMRKHNPLPADPTKGDRMRYACSCPPHGKVSFGLLRREVWKRSPFDCY